MIKVYIIDRDLIFKRGLHKLLRAEKDFAVIDGPDDESELVMDILINKPDVIVLGNNLNGIRIAGEILKKYRFAKIIMFSTRIDGRHIAESIRMGIKGYSYRGCGIDEMVNGIRKVINGETFFCKSAASMYRKFNEELLYGRDEVMIRPPYQTEYRVYS